MQETFSKMGLIPSEYNELIVSWLPQMTDNPWNLIMVDVKVEQRSGETQDFAGARQRDSGFHVIQGPGCAD